MSLPSGQSAATRASAILKFRDPGGRQLDAAFRVETLDGYVTVVVESRSGPKTGPKARNPDYYDGVESLLGGLRDLGAGIVEITVDSATARRELPIPQDRMLPLEYPLVAGNGDLRELRLRIGNAAAATARREGAKSTGSGEKRLRFLLDLDAARDIEVARALTHGADPDRRSGSSRFEGRPPHEGQLSATQGRSTDAARNRATENRAMRLAVEHFQAAGWQVEDVSGAASFDLRAKRGRQERHIEVKGTSGLGLRVVLTSNEVDHHRRNVGRAVLFVVSQIRLSKEGEGWVADGGQVQVTSPWDVDTGLLEPKDFYWSTSSPPPDEEVR